MDVLKEKPAPGELMVRKASLFNEVGGLARFANQKNRGDVEFVGGNADHLLLGEFLQGQEADFGGTLSNAEIVQLLKRGRGVVYFAFDGKTNEKVGYAIVQTQSLEEEHIQDEMRWRRGAFLFHDHLDYDLPQGTVLFADLGIVKGLQGRGWGTQLAKRVKEEFEAEYGPKWWMAFIRFNNSSLIILNKVFGMSMIGVQGPKPSGVKFGSKEDNFRGDTIIPALKELPSDLSARTVITENSSKPHDLYWFLPWRAGEQSDLNSSPWIKKLLKQTMAYGRRSSPDGEDYAMRKVCSATELVAAGFDDLPTGYKYFLLFKKIEVEDFGYGMNLK